MASIGDALRQQRVRGQQTVAEAAKAAGLPKRLLIELESGAVPPEDSQALAYLRIYARHLGLDAEELLRRNHRNGNGRPAVSDQRAARRRWRHGTRQDDARDRLTPLTPDRGRPTVDVPPASASPTSARPAAGDPASSPPPASPASPATPTRRWAAFALLGAVIVAVAVAAGVVLWDTGAVPSLMSTGPLLAARRLVDGPDRPAPVTVGITVGVHRPAAAASRPRTP